MESRWVFCVSMIGFGYGAMWVSNILWFGLFCCFSGFGSGFIVLALSVLVWLYLMGVVLLRLYAMDLSESSFLRIYYHWIVDALFFLWSDYSLFLLLCCVHSWLSFLLLWIQLLNSCVMHLFLVDIFDRIFLVKVEFESPDPASNCWWLFRDSTLHLKILCQGYTNAFVL